MLFIMLIHLIRLCGVENDVVVYYGDYMVIKFMVIIFCEIACYGELCIMVYGLQSSFGLL